MSFLRNFFASLLAITVFFMALFFILLSVASADQLVIVKEGSVVHIKMSRPITEREMENPFEGLPVAPGPPSSIGLVQFRNMLDHARDDERISGLCLDLDGFSAGMAHIEEMRNDIIDFKSSGKFIYSYAQYYGEGGYYLASATDSVFLHPEGNLEFNGMSAQVFFLKNMFEKIGMEPQIFRVGDFKSAVEPFIREDMSEESRLQMTEMLEDINSHMIGGIASARNLNPDSLAAISYRMDVQNAQLAYEAGLVDGLTYSDEFMDVLQERTGLEELNLVSYGDYTNSYNPSYSSKNKIAVIMASGDIVTGKGGNEIIGSDEFIKTIKKAREDQGIKAIVLRVNSPGGSYLASDAIWREVKLAAETKPVIASMSNYAASGGYYIAMAADTIVAQPNTITGSIGIFSILFNAQELFEDKLGITFDGVKTGQFSDIYTSNRPLRPEERAIIQKEVENNYDTFIRKAAEGRDMDEAQMRKIASGRVWTGHQALDNGLVDVLGGLQTAVEIAADKAGISEEYNLRYYPPQKSLLEELLGMDEASVKENALKHELGTMYPIFKEVKKLQRLEGAQARMPYSIEIN